MKNSATCPKCQSQEIYRVPHNPMNGADPRIQTGLTDLSGFPVTRYLCGQCGFLEEWIAAPGDLRKLVGQLPGPVVLRGRTGPDVQVLDASKCPACGADLAPEDMVCPACGINFGRPL